MLLRVVTTDEFWAYARRAVPTSVKNPLRSLRSAFHLAQFVAAKKLGGFEVNDSPHFCDEGRAAFADAIENAGTYLEYGSGASTVFAHEYVTNLISVDSDRDVLKAVRRRISHQVSRSVGERALIHANIGPVKEWGRPVFTRQTETRVQRWKAYAQAPWIYLRRHALQPDMILVDGQFRVACALESLTNLERESRCKIFVDDYLSRPEYRIIERYSELVDMKGRMAILTKRPDLSAEECRFTAEQYILDCR